MYFALRVTKPDGESFWAKGDFAYVLEMPEEAVIDLAPGGVSETDIDLGYVVANDGFFADPRLWEPGRYSFEFIMSDRLDERMGKPRDVPSDALTAIASFEVVVPRGKDIQVWQMIRERAVGSAFRRQPLTQRREIAREILTTTGGGSYAAHLLLLQQPNSESELDNVVRQAEALNDMDLAARARVAKAGVIASRYRTEFFDGSRNAPVTLRALKAELEAALDATDDLNVKRRAENILATLYPRGRD